MPDRRGTVVWHDTAGRSFAGMLPACPPARTNQTVPELLFGSGVMVVVGRLVILAVAVVLLVCAVFVLVSVVVRMRRGHWLRRAGPFEVSETVMGDVGLQAQALAEVLTTREGQLVEFEFLLEHARRALNRRSERR